MAAEGADAGAAGAATGAGMGAEAAARAAAAADAGAVGAAAGAGIGAEAAVGAAVAADAGAAGAAASAAIEAEAAAAASTAAFISASALAEFVLGADAVARAGGLEDPCACASGFWASAVPEPHAIATASVMIHRTKLMATIKYPVRNEHIRSVLPSDSSLREGWR